MAVISGTSASDFLVGTIDDDTLLGLEDNDELRGNPGNDELRGGPGDDVLDGVTLSDDVSGDLASGVDTLIGGAGNDRYEIDDKDVVIEDKDAGSDDHVIYRGPSGAVVVIPNNVEFLSIRPVVTSTVGVRAYGNSANNVLFSAEQKSSDDPVSNNTLLGLGGNDLLIGAEGSGDTLAGGIGRDTYEFSIDAQPRIIEARNSGERDSIRIFGLSSFEFSLQGHPNIEDLYYVGVIEDNFPDPVEGRDPPGFIKPDSLPVRLIGNDRGNRIFGGDRGDVLIGLDGSDRLFGGLGDDRLHGGLGNDYLEVDSPGDTTIERRGQGTDTVGTMLNRYRLDNSEGANIENLVAVEYQGPAARLFVGNRLDNKIVGGRAADTLYGLAGDDWLLGGRGQDVLIGGYGNDDFDIDAGDVVRESARAGHDTVRSTGNCILPPNVEDLVFRGAGSESFRGTGNGLSNTIIGGKGNDVVRGLGGGDTLIGLNGSDSISGGRGNDTIYGGRGNDNLAGGLGRDGFVFEFKPSARSNSDTIRDFRPIDDTIFLDKSAFAQAGIAGTVLADDAFHIGSQAQDTADRVIYDYRTGALYFDPDGLGGNVQLKFGQLKRELGITHLDFVIF